MIDYETFSKIKTCHDRQGLKPSQIADALGIDVRTVQRYLARQHFVPRKGPLRASRLDPYKAEICRLLEQHAYSAVQIYQRIGEQGFDGGYTIVKDYVRKVRPPKHKAFLTLSFAPAECAQVDWGCYGTVAVGSTVRRLSFFVMVLCYSRLMYLRFSVSETMEHFLEGHREAFAFFGGVPHKIMVDNLKSAVLRRSVGKAPLLNPKYLDFANHYGFAIAPCAVGKGNEKGRVESGVGYVKKNLLSGLQIADFSHLPPAAEHWRDNTANVRIHSQTGEKPVVLFEKERGGLKPLPPLSYDIATIESVRACRQFRVVLDTNRYSVPCQYAGMPLTLKIYPDRLCLYDREKLIARHVRSYDRRQDFENPDHVKPLLQQRKKARDQKIYIRFLSLSDNADAYYRQLREHRFNPLHHMRQIVALSEIHGPEATARAIDDAFHFKAFSCEYIANLLEQRTRLQAEPSPLHLTRRQDLLDLTLEKPDMSIYARVIEDPHQQEEEPPS
jgi:transposase